jgi:hypothetical protein
MEENEGPVNGFPPLLTVSELGNPELATPELNA